MVNSSTISLCIPAIFVNDSVQHWVIPTYASIQIGGAQCKCVCTTSCLFGKWLVEAESSNNGKVTWQTTMEYLWGECVIGAMNMPFLINLKSNLCPAGGHQFIAKGAPTVSDLAHYPYACSVLNNTPLELTAECLLADLLMRISCTVPHITPAPANKYA